MLAADFWILSHYTSALFFKVVILSIYLCFTDHLSMQVHFIEILRKVQLHLILQKYLQNTGIYFQSWKGQSWLAQQLQSWITLQNSRYQSAYNQHPAKYELCSLVYYFFFNIHLLKKKYQEVIRHSNDMLSYKSIVCWILRIPSNDEMYHNL